MQKKKGGVCACMSGVTDGSDSGEGDSKERDQRTMTQCARTGDNRRGYREGVGGRRVREDREKRKKTTEERYSSAPCTTNPEDAHPGSDMQLNLHPL